MRSRRPAFTLIELLASIAVLSLLLALLLPAIQAVRESARRTVCRTNLEQIGIALRNYEGTHQTFPPGYVYMPAPDPALRWTWSTGAGSALQGAGRSNRDPLERPFIYDSLVPFGLAPPNDPGWNWFTMILPQLEQATIYRQIDFHQATNHPANQATLLRPLEIAVCPSDTGAGRYAVLDDGGWEIAAAETTSYVACFGKFGLINLAPDDGNGMFQRNSRVRVRDVTDGLSQTMALGERPATFTKAPWAGAITNGTVRTTPGAPVFGSTVEQSPCMTLARIGTRALQDRFSEPYDFFSMHPGQVNFVFADGTVRDLAAGVDLGVLHALATREGHEAVQVP